MELLLKSIQMDWAVLLPIFICSILTVGVALNRWAFYNDNKRDIVAFIRSLRGELVKNNLSGAQLLSAQLGGVIFISLNIFFSLAIFASIFAG